MESTLTYLGRGISAEALKIKFTWAFWLSLLAPLSIVGMTFLVFFFRGEKLVRPGMDPWLLWANNNFYATAQLLVPMFLALITALVNGIEHSSLGWKQLYALPMPKWAVFLNKYLLQLGLVALSFVTFLAGLLAGGYLLGWVRSDLGFQDYHHVQSIAVTGFRIFIGSLAIFTLQFCISFRFKSIAMSIGLGILFTLAFLIGSRWEHIGYFPYSWPYFSAMTFTIKPAGLFIEQMWYSLGLSVLVLLGALYASTRRQIH
ncbi:ABC transporter permease subunit [Nibribacter ruber]|uniref:ABC transporter permease subunit n=1 Tax=Nibribacter ruber TaxID=2698458 RepID=A0A6P1NU15_9BACT|nr:ABC transporter permease [Nibribacter ruber]QHL86540.1 ABC transporter permease subunit [Nibribacter ruber]